MTPPSGCPIRSWCAYATSVAATIDEEATAIESAWSDGVDGEPPFAEVVADGDQAQEWLAMFVDDNIQLVRLLGRPIGDEGDVPSADPYRDREVAAPRRRPTCSSPSAR